MRAGRSDPEGLRVRTLHAGEPFGEMALLTNEPRTATIRAETDCRVLRLPRSSFLDPGARRAERRPCDRCDAQPKAGRPARPDSASRQGAAGSQPDPSAGSTATSAAGRTGRRQGKSAPRRPCQGGRPASAGRERGRSPRAAVILAAGWALPPPEGLSPAAWHALLLLLATVPPLAFQALLEGVLALLLACAWVLTGVAGAADALSGFASVNWILIVSVLIVGAAIARTGLLYRFALVAASRMRGGFAGEVTALMLCGAVAQSGGAELDGPGHHDRADAARAHRGARISAEVEEARSGLAMAALVGFGLMIATTLTSGTTTLLVAAVLPAEPRRTVDWISWTVDAAPFNAILFAGLLGTIIWFYRPRRASRGRGGRTAQVACPAARTGRADGARGEDRIGGRRRSARRLPEPAAPPRRSGLGRGDCGRRPRRRPASSTPTRCRTVNWNFALLFGVLISLVTVFERTGLDQWTGGRISGALGDIAASRLEFLVLLVALCFAISLVMRWQAAAPLVTITLGAGRRLRRASVRSSSD